MNTTTKNTPVKFTSQELTDIKTEMVAQGNISEETMSLVIEKLSQVGAPKVKLPTGEKGIKIALKRKGNALGVSFEANVTMSGENTIDNLPMVKLSNFTGTPDDFAVLKGVAAKNGYSLEG